MNRIRISLSPKCPVALLDGLLNDHAAWAFDEIAYRNRKALEKNNLIVVLNTVGGSFSAMKSILTTLDHVKARGPGVVTYGYGKVWSAGTILLSAGDWRLLAPHSEYGLHSASCRIDDADADLVAEEVKRCNAQLTKLYKHYSQGMFGPCQSAPWLESQSIQPMPHADVLNHHLADEVGNLGWLDEQFVPVETPESR